MIREVITPLYWPTLPLGAFLSTFKDSAHPYKVNGNFNGSPPPAAQPLCSSHRRGFRSSHAIAVVVPLTQTRWSFLSLQSSQSRLSFRSFNRGCRSAHSNEVVVPLAQLAVAVVAFRSLNRGGRSSLVQFTIKMSEKKNIGAIAECHHF